MFFETAVIGVIAPRVLGVARRCVECRAQSQDRAGCGGFGSGCLTGPPARQETPSESSSRRLDKA